MCDIGINTDREFPTDYLVQWCFIGDDKAEQISRFLRRPNGLDICGPHWTVPVVQEQCEHYFAALYRHKVVVIVGQEDVRCAYCADDIIGNLKSLFEYLRTCVTALIVCTISPDPEQDDAELAKLATVNHFIASYPTCLPSTRPALVACLDLVPIFVTPARCLIPTSYEGTILAESPTIEPTPWSSLALEQVTVYLRGIVNRLPWKLSTASDDEATSDSTLSEPSASSSAPRAVTDSDPDTPKDTTSSDGDSTPPVLKRVRSLDPVERDYKLLTRMKKRLRRHSPIKHP